jgi:hypothetical protein
MKRDCGMRPDVRFGPLVDIEANPSRVRFPPKADITEHDCYPNTDVSVLRITRPNALKR